MPTMNVILTEEMVKFVETEVSRGEYVSASEVVRDAIRVLRRDRQVEGLKLRLLGEEIDKGIEEAESGAFSSRSVDEIAKDVLREFRR